jgi:hypothetical protein
LYNDCPSYAEIVEDSHSPPPEQIDASHSPERHREHRDDGSEHDAPGAGTDEEEPNFEKEASEPDDDEVEQDISMLSFVKSLRSLM